MSEGGPISETLEQENVLVWIRENGLAEDIDEASVGDWLLGIGSGAASGAATGAAAGPWGALIGGVLGGALGAAQTAARSSQPSPAPRPPAPRPPARQQPIPRAPAPPPRPSVPAPRGGGQTVVSTQLLQQVVQLLPQLTQLLAQQARTTEGAEASVEHEPSPEAGDAVPDDAFSSYSGAKQDRDEVSSAVIDRGIDQPIGEHEAENTPSPEYPLATRFEPAAAGNFRSYAPTRTNPQRVIRRIVIHITDGGANINGTINWFKNPASGVSAHYIVGQDGEVVQMVAHNDIAFHAHGGNADSIGIEHVANTRGLRPTEAQYCSSAALVRWLCERYKIPLDRTHILGHAELDRRTTHAGCPNAVWNWDYFMGMVTSGSCYPTPTVLRPTEQEFVSDAETIQPEAYRPSFATPPLWSESFIWPNDNVVAEFTADSGWSLEGDGFAWTI